MKKAADDRQENHNSDSSDPYEELKREVEETIKTQNKPRSKKRQQKKQQEKIAGQLGGERGIADILIKLGRGKVCRDHSENQWYVFKEHSWRRDYFQEHFSLTKELKKVLRLERVELSQEPDKNQLILKAVDSALKSLNDLNHCKRVLEFATKGAHSLGIKGDEWDKNIHLLAFRNGVVDLNTFEFRPGRPEDFLKESLGYDWDSFEAVPVEWISFLETVLPVDINDPNKDPEKDVINYIQKLLGAALSGQVSEHILPILNGSGQNGKGTALEVLAEVLGPLACPVASEMLMQQTITRNSSNASADLMALRGKRLIWASESNEGRKLESGKVKLLTGGDSITARAPYGKHQVTFKPTHQLVLITNHAPVVDPDDKALWYRLRLISFPLSFVETPAAANERKKDTGLKAKLVAEAPAIMAWIIRGYRKYQIEGLQPPTAVLMATQDYRSENDILRNFIDEELTTDPKGRLAARKLYEAYVKWALKSGLKPMTNPMFGKKIKEKIEMVSRKYVGFKLRKAV